MILIIHSWIYLGKSYNWTMVGGFQYKNPNFSGLLEKTGWSEDLTINEPEDGEIYKTSMGGGAKNIKVAGWVNPMLKAKVLVVIRTDIDYCKALITTDESGVWEFPRVDLSAVDHQIYAVAIDKNDRPIIRSKVIHIRLERG